MSKFVNDVYADRVINGNPSNFTGVEVNGVRYTGERTEDGEQEVIVDNDKPDFYSCYLRHKDGRSLSCADLGTASEAVEYGYKLAKEHGWIYYSAVKES